MPRGHDSRGAVHSGPRTGRPRSTAHRCAPHPDPEPRVGWPGVSLEGLLGRNRSRDRILGAREREEERVSLRVDLVAVVRRERLTDQAAVLGQQLAVSLAQLPKQAGRPLDVGEDERHRAGRELGHPTSRVARTPDRVKRHVSGWSTTDNQTERPGEISCPRGSILRPRFPRNPSGSSCGTWGDAACPR